ncbi:hypothetical protein GGI00_005759, partial [Coemansia sp. RSA 2681]
MVHVKVIMDASNITIVPMVRSVVFARARERILTKLFQGGVPFVDSKRRKLAVRKPDGSMVVVADNQTWRCVMEAASAARANQPGVAAGATTAGYKTVVKLTLHLIDPAELTDRLATTGGPSSEKNMSRTPLPQSLDKECIKAAKILNSFVTPGGLGTDKYIPSSILERAKGVAFLTVLKAGFIWSGRVGFGLVVAR